MYFFVFFLLNKHREEQLKYYLLTLPLTACFSFSLRTKTQKAAKKNRWNFHILTRKKLEHRYKAQEKQIQQINQDVNGVWSDEETVTFLQLIH